MSLDLYLTCCHCDQCPDHGLNSTYNVAPMWYAIHPESKQFVDIDGMTGFQAKQLILDTIAKSLDRQSELQNMNPKNGWGSYESYMQFLHDICVSCTEYPDLIWTSSR